METTKNHYFNNLFNLKEAIKIHTDREYKHLIDKALSLEVDNIDYFASNYKPQELRHAIGEKLNARAVKENRELRESFYNSNSRGC